MIEAIGSGTRGTAAAGARDADLGNGTHAARGVRFAGPVGDFVTDLVDTARAGDPERDTDEEREFRTALLVELERRYLRAVRGHRRAAAVPRVWQVVLESSPAAVAPVRTVLAGAYALAGHDLAPAVVSACTLLGRNPGRAERAVVDALLDLVSRLVVGAAATADPATRADATELAVLLARGEGWWAAEHLWTVRGRPSEAAKERAALDWRAALVARALLGEP